MSASSIDTKSDRKVDDVDDTAENRSLDNFLTPNRTHNSVANSEISSGNANEDASLFSFADAPAETKPVQTSSENAEIEAAFATPLARELTPTPPTISPEIAPLPVETPVDASSHISSTRSVANASHSDSETGVRREAAVTTTVYLALGSNLGERLVNLREAIARLERHPGCEITAKSRVYETQSVEGGGDAPYLNAVVRANWAGSAMSLLRCTQGVEERMGRPRPPRSGPRIIDVDILLFGESVIDNAHLVIPHPRMMQRAFVLRPLCDVLENGWLREFPVGRL